ncbi:hypothetical protein BT69DRAFT_669939 [Atractiella rhizophila]|nr:hypothetical protein BT69DRAFT_669939 [Atractiella rhizophila]
MTSTTKQVWPTESPKAPPTEKQKGFAEQLVKSRAVREEELDSVKTKGEMSEFIAHAVSDAKHTGQTGFDPIKAPSQEQRDGPATQAQLNFASRLGKSTFVDSALLDSGALKTKGAVSDFIQDSQRAIAHAADGPVNPVKTVKPGQAEDDPPTKKQLEFAQRCASQYFQGEQFTWNV